VWLDTPEQVARAYVYVVAALRLRKPDATTNYPATTDAKADSSSSSSRDSPLEATVVVTPVLVRCRGIFDMFNRWAHTLEAVNG
jgi:hypothetical protein